jgi:hypothetical protein
VIQYQLIFSKYVQNDLKDIINWYAKINIKISNTFIEQFYECIRIIKENPTSFEIRYENKRIAFLKIFLLEFIMKLKIMLLKFNQFSIPLEIQIFGKKEINRSFPKISRNLNFQIKRNRKSISCKTI